jgi:hypothetical protein
MKKSEFKQFLKEEIYKKLLEVKISKPGELYPIVDSSMNIDYDNLVKNIKKYKGTIKSRLKITDIDELNEFLTHYVNAYSEIEHQGDQELYLDMSLEEFMSDIEAVYGYTDKEDWDSSPEYDTITINDIK